APRHGGTASRQTDPPPRCPRRPDPRIRTRSMTSDRFLAPHGPTTCCRVDCRTYTTARRSRCRAAILLPVCSHGITATTAPRAPAPPPPPRPRRPPPRRVLVRPPPPPGGPPPPASTPPPDGAPPVPP